MAFLLIAIFLTTDSGSVAPSSSGTVAANEVSLTPDEKTRLEQTESELAERVKGDAEDAGEWRDRAIREAFPTMHQACSAGQSLPTNCHHNSSLCLPPEALEGLAVTRAQLGKYSEAEKGLQQLVKIRGSDAGESKQGSLPAE